MASATEEAPAAVAEPSDPCQGALAPVAPPDNVLCLARHSTDLNVDLAHLPTILSPELAAIITSFAVSTRVSLRVAVYFIESLLDVSQFSTRVSLSYARRFLISALSFARHAHTYPLNTHIILPASTDAFLLTLDKYTSMGIHIVQHTFSLVELFAMSGFYLTASAVQTAHHAAQESVTLLDGLFGSTQSSRALAAIIEMVRRELDMEGRVKGKKGKSKKMGLLGGLGMLTKAITAFACLQITTWERTRGKQKMIEVHNYHVRPVAAIKQSSPVKASPTAQYLTDPIPATQAAVTLRSAPTSSPNRPKRKRSQTLENGGAPGVQAITSPSSPASVSVPRPRPRSDRYVRSRSLDLTREIANAQKSPVSSGAGSSHARAGTGSGMSPTSQDQWNPMTLVPQALPSTGMTLEQVDAEMAEVSHTAENTADAQATMATIGPPGPSASLSSLSEVQSTVTAPRLPNTRRVISSSYGDSRSDGCFPQRHLLHNLHRFMKYSSAAYGQLFLRVFGTDTSDYAFPSTAQHHSDSWAFAQYTGIPIECLLLCSYVDTSPMFDGHKAPPLVHFVAVDHAAEAIVLTCRGTLGLSDILVDLTCAYRTINVNQAARDGEYYVHEGMYEAALGLCAQDSRVHRTVASALAQYPTYGLVICGHSLGGGVAALLALLTAIPATSYTTTAPAHPSGAFVTSPASGLPPGRPIHCYAYGPPAVMSPDLARYTEGLVSSIVQDSDLIPCLSLGTLRDLKNIAVTMSEEQGLAEEVFSRVVGMHKNPLFGDVKPPDADSLADWLVALVSTLRADMHNDKLYPPGIVYVMEVHEVLSTVGAVVAPSMDSSMYQSHRAVLRRCTSVEERFREPIFARTMLNDHLPSNYERSTRLLLKGMLQEEEEAC